MVQHILLVEDEQDIRHALRDLLESEIKDVAVQTASSGPVALDRLEARGFDLILCDHRMAGMSGLDFLIEAKRRHGLTPALILTAYPDPVLARRAVTEAGVSLVVAKPMDLDFFIRVVRGILVDPKKAPFTPQVYEA